MCIEGRAIYTTYMVRSVVESTGGASVKFCIKEVYKTLKNNLVEK